MEIKSVIIDVAKVMKTELEKKEVKGYPGLVWHQLMPLNRNPKFKQKFKDIDLRLLINIVDGEYAALIMIKDGEVQVESVKNGNKDYMKKLYKEYNCNGMLETNLATLIELAQGGLSTAAMVKKIIGKKMRVKGVKNLRFLTDLLDFNLKSKNVHSKSLLKDVK